MVWFNNDADDQGSVYRDTNCLADDDDGDDDNDDDYFCVKFLWKSMSNWHDDAEADDNDGDADDGGDNDDYYFCVKFLWKTMSNLHDDDDDDVLGQVEDAHDEEPRVHPGGHQGHLQAQWTGQAEVQYSSQ